MYEPSKTHEEFSSLLLREIGAPTIGCEVGVWRGGLSKHLLLTFPELWLLMIDRYEVYHAGGRGQVSQVTTQEGMFEALNDAVTKTMFANNRRMVIVGGSVIASNLMADHSLDFCFLDAGHDYESVRADIESYQNKVRPGGLFCGHDYNGNRDKVGVFGVKRAVDEFAKENDYEVGHSKRTLWWIKVR